MDDIMALARGDVNCAGTGCGMHRCKDRDKHNPFAVSPGLNCGNFDPHDDYEVVCEFTFGEGWD